MCRKVYPFYILYILKDKIKQIPYTIFLKSHYNRTMIYNDIKTSGIKHQVSKTSHHFDIFLLTIFWKSHVTAGIALFKLMSNPQVPMEKIQHGMTIFFVHHIPMIFSHFLWWRFSWRFLISQNSDPVVRFTHRPHGLNWVGGWPSKHIDPDVGNKKDGSTGWCRVVQRFFYVHI